MNKPIATLLQKEMTRKEFLLTAGLGLASTMGLSAVIHLFTGKSFDANIRRHTGPGYGSSSYGGGKD